MKAQSCPTLCDPMDYIVHVILQARILEWGRVFPFSRGNSQPRDWTQVSHSAGGFFTGWAPRVCIWVHIYIFKLVFLDKYLEVELLDHIISLFLVFWGTSILLFIMASPIYISTNSAWEFPFLHIFTNIVLYFDDRYSEWYEVISHSDFDLHFPVSDAVYLSMCPFFIHMFSL